MLLKMYAVFDKIAGKCLCTFSDVNDGMAVRNNAPALSRVAPLQDLQLNCIGSFDDETMSISSCPVVAVSWDSYKFPESPVTPLPTNIKGGKK